MSELVVYNDYSVTREGKILHISDCKDNTWQDARDRRGKTREPSVKLVESAGSR
jgi:mannose-1-phosphate guanylyltransferase